MTLIAIDDVRDADRIRCQMPAYLAELTRFDPEEAKSGPPVVYPYLEHYWREPDRSAFVISFQGEDCGFVLVRRIRSGTEAPDYHSIAEFYVQPDRRRTGLGQLSVKETIKLFSGQWLIQVLENNTPALAFWQEVLNEIAGSKLEPEFDGRFFNFWLTT